MNGWEEYLRRGSILMLLLVAIGCSGPAEAGDVEFGEVDSEVLSVDQLLSISSVVGGEVPQWSPDGTAVLFSGGGGLNIVSPDGGDISRLGVDVGGAGHFLASQKPRYSPDGEWISYVSVKAGSQELWLWSEDRAEDVQLTNLGARINSYSWSPDGRWIAFAGDRHGTFDIWKVEVSSRRVFRLTNDKRYEVYPTWTPHSQNILYVRMDDRWVDHDVFVMTADGGAARHLVSDTDFFDYQSGGRFGYPMVSPDGSQVLFRSHRSGWRNFWTVPIEGGEPRQVAPEESDQKGGQWSPDGRFIAFTSLDNGTHRLKVVASDGSGSPETVVEPEGLGMVADPAWSPDGERLSYTLQTPSAPTDLFVVSLANSQVVRLTDSRPTEAAAATLLEPEKIEYESTDGYTIPSYLYVPPDAESGGPYPALLWIHGGPTSQFNDSFQQHVQFFAQKGYVVLMPNIRGSSGYGKAFEEGNMGCWGRCDGEDVIAGVDYLKSLSYVDTQNIGITGTSYGGIMSMAVPTFFPDVFQAAIPIAGYADYPHFMEEQELRHIKLLEYELGPLEENRELYEYLSPINFVKDITTPYFVIHGAGFFPESDASAHFVTELERHYKPFRYEVYPNENYYVRGRENRRQMLLDMLEFLEQHLGEHRIVQFGPVVE